MSGTLTNNLSREKIQQLLTAVGSETTEDTTQIEATEYDWHQPHYFNSDQLSKLDDFTEKVATAVAEKFAHLCHSDFNVTITSTTQHFADEFLNHPSNGEQSDYYLTFGTDQDHPCGLISIPPQTAVIWATQLLGGSESEEDSGRDLSQLEESLLLDIASAVVEAVSDSYDNHDFLPARSIVRGRLPLELQGVEELCKITLGVRKADLENSSEAHLLIPCRRLEPVVGKTTQADDEFSAEDISKAILDRLQQISVSVTAQLASTVLAFEEIVNLQVDDVLLLDKKINEPIELIVEGLTVLHGWPGKSAGKHAVVITGHQDPICQKRQMETSKPSCNTSQSVNLIAGT